MAIIQLSGPSSRSASLGQAAGSGLGNMLTGLANLNLKEYADKRQSRRSIQSLMGMGVPGKEAASIANLPASIQNLYMKKHLDAGSQGVQSENLSSGLAALGLSEEDSKAISNLPPAVQRIYLKQLLEERGVPKSRKPVAKEKSPDEGEGEGGSLPKGAVNISNAIKAAIGKGKKLPKEVDGWLSKSGFDKKHAAAIKGTKLTPDIVDFFLSKSGGNPEKAKVLAKKYGFKV